MSRSTETNGSAWNVRAKWAFAVFAIIGGFFLLLEHRAHVLPLLPWLLLAACPLMHLFMRHDHAARDHGTHGDGGASSDRARSSGTDMSRDGAGTNGVAHRHDGAQS